MRALIATAGLLALAGVAAAATTHPVTLRSSSSSVDAVTQDGSFVGWLAAGGSKCNLVHVLTPKGLKTFPRPAPNSMTCHWDISAGVPQLALAVQSSTALWSLHKSGSAAFDYVMSAKVGGNETQIERLAHDSDGTGWWLGGLAGAGTILAYSSVDIEYVDKLGCLSGGSCKKTIAGGSIKVVSNGTATALPASGPALELAVANGRIAYVPAAAVAKNGSPAPAKTGTVDVADATTGIVQSHAETNGVPVAIALSQHILAVLTRKGAGARLTWYDATAGTKLGAIAVPRMTPPHIGATDTMVVYRVGSVLRAVLVSNRRTRNLARLGGACIGPSVEHNRLIWAENAGKAGQIRSLSLN